MYIKRITANDDDIDVKTYATIRGILLTSGADASSLTLYDSPTQSGSIIAKLKAPAEQSVYIDWPLDVSARNGMSVTLTGTSPEAYLYFE